MRRADLPSWVSLTGRTRGNLALRPSACTPALDAALARAGRSVLRPLARQAPGRTPRPKQLAHTDERRSTARASDPARRAPPSARLGVERAGRAPDQRGFARLRSRNPARCRRAERALRQQRFSFAGVRHRTARRRRQRAQRERAPRLPQCVSSASPSASARAGAGDGLPTLARTGFSPVRLLPAAISAPC